MNAVTELLSDFWYAVTHSIGYAIVTNEFIIWTMAALLVMWIAGIIYNETNDPYGNDSLSSSNEQ